MRLDTASSKFPDLLSLMSLVGSIEKSLPFCKVSIVLDLCPHELCQIYKYLLPNKLRRDCENPELISVCDFTYITNCYGQGATLLFKEHSSMRNWHLFHEMAIKN